MTKILILGAYGQIARVATQLLLERTDAVLTLAYANRESLERTFGQTPLIGADGSVLRRVGRTEPTSVS